MDPISCNNESFTENGAVTLNSSTDPRLDLFFKTVRDLGGKLPRNTGEAPDDFYNDDKNKRLFNLIEESWKHNPLDTMKILMNWRDCRGGKGDKRGFLDAMIYVEKHHKNWFLANFNLIPEYGTWLDLIKLWHFVSNKSKDAIIYHIGQQLITDITKNQDYLIEKCNDPDNQPKRPNISLLAKWIPSENSKWDKYFGSKKKGFLANLCKHVYGVNNISYGVLMNLRKEYISPLRKTIDIVERNLCANTLENIKYQNVPSVAMLKYKSVFTSKDTERFSKYMDDVKTGKVEIKSDQVYPHDLVKWCLENSIPDDVVEQQWTAIKKKTQELGVFQNSLCICDVSGSMSGVPITVAIALGLLGLNNNKVMTFSESPELHTVKEKTLFDQVQNLKKMKWGMNTDFSKVIDIVYNMCIENPNKSIKRIFCFSDMQFDEAFTNATHFEVFKKKFSDINMEMPNIIFWNLRGDTDGVPVSCNEKGVVLLSGYSPSLLTSILEGEELTPLSVMTRVITSSRYDKIINPEDKKFIITFD